MSVMRLKSAGTRMFVHKCDEADIKENIKPVLLAPSEGIHRWAGNFRQK